MIFHYSLIIHCYPRLFTFPDPLNLSTEESSISQAFTMLASCYRHWPTPCEIDFKMMFQHEPFHQHAQEIKGMERYSGFLVLFPTVCFKVQIHIQHWIYTSHAHVDGPFSMKNSLENKIGIKLHTLQAGPMMSQPTDVCILSYIYLLKHK